MIFLLSMHPKSHMVRIREDQELIIMDYPIGMGPEKSKNKTSRALSKKWTLLYQCGGMSPLRFPTIFQYTLMMRYSKNSIFLNTKINAMQ